MRRLPGYAVTALASAVFMCACPGAGAAGATAHQTPTILSASWGTDDGVGCPNGPRGLDNIPVTFNWFIRGGSAGAALYKFQQPGIYAYVTHNLIEAADLGATAHFKVEGKWNDDLMTQVKAPAEIPPAGTN